MAAGKGKAHTAVSVELVWGVCPLAEPDSKAMGPGRIWGGSTLDRHVGRPGTIRYWYCTRHGVGQSGNPRLVRQSFRSCRVSNVHTWGWCNHSRSKRSSSGALTVIQLRWEEGEVSIQGGSLCSEVCHLVLVRLDFCMQRLQVLVPTDQRVGLWGMVAKRVRRCISSKRWEVRRWIPPIHGGSILPFTS